MSEPNPPRQAESEALRTLAALLEVIVCLDRHGFDELDELTHAYAVSIHRSQGSEYPRVVVPLTMSAWLMLQRNLLSTAVTRAQCIVVLVGSRRTLAKAVRTQGAGRRYTALTERLQPGRAEPPQCSRPWDGRLQQVPVELEERVRGRVRPAERSE
jgi:UvrD-like helicase C-terminal domain